MPVGPRDAVHRAWKLHAGNVRHALVNGIYQGWDLHPAQLPSRYTAVFAFFLEGLAPTSERLKNFVQKAAQATRVGDVFDDAATGQGLLNYFLRAMQCGAITESEAVERSGLDGRRDSRPLLRRDRHGTAPVAGPRALVRGPGPFLVRSSQGPDDPERRPKD